jgi:hypothetical protein
MFDDAPIVYAYTRAQALEDGFLVDVSKDAAEGGFTIPVAMSREAWADTVQWDDNVDKRKPFTGNDERGRLWDVITMARHAALKAGGDDLVAFTVLRIPAEGRGTTAKPVTLWMQIGPGDDGSPVITIMRPEDY